MIGENANRGRTASYAADLRAKGIQAEAWSPTGPREFGYWENKAALNQYVDDGYRIVDIGPGKGNRNYPLISSDYYRMERAEIERRAYTDYFPVRGVP